MILQGFEEDMGVTRSSMMVVARSHERERERERGGSN